MKSATKKAAKSQSQDAQFSLPSPVRPTQVDPMAQAKAFMSGASTATKSSRKKDRAYFDEREVEVQAGIDAHGNPLTKKVNIPLLCKEFRTAKLKEEEFKKIKEARVAGIRDVLDPWHDAQYAQGKLAPTIDIELDDFTVQFQYQDKFSLFDLGKKDDLQEAIGVDNFNALFVEKSSLAVAESVMSNPDRLVSLVQKLQQVMSPDEFASFFEFTTKIAARPNLDANRFAKLSEEQNAALVQVGLKQTVACKLVVEKEKG
jgi:hypothetical protein